MVTGSKKRKPRPISRSQGNRSKQATAPVAAPSSSASATSSSSASSGIVVQRTPEQERVNSLNKEHQRLLRDIAKKRKALQATEAWVAELVQSLSSQVAPLRAELFGLVRDLVATFEALLGPQSDLTRKDKARVRRVFAQLLDDLPPELQAEAQAHFQADADSEPDEDEAPSSAGRRRQHAHSDRVPNPEAEAGYSAAKPTEEKAGTLRALFRRLAIALHPDKVQDPQEKAARESVMKDITRAYEAGDIARLVELSQSHLAEQEPLSDAQSLQRQAEHLLRANLELRRQLRQLTAQIKASKAELPFDLEQRSGTKAQDAARVELDVLVGSVKQELESFRRLRNFVHSFARGEIGIQEFLMGPPRSIRAKEQLLDEIAEMFLSDLDDFEAPRRGRGRRR